MYTPIIAINNLDNIKSNSIFTKNIKSLDLGQGEISDDKFVIVISNEEFDKLAFNTLDEFKQVKELDGVSILDISDRFQKHISYLTALHSGLILKEVLDYILIDYYGINLIPVNVIYPNISDGKVIGRSSFHYSYDESMYISSDVSVVNGNIEETSYEFEEDFTYESDEYNNTLAESLDLFNEFVTATKSKYYTKIWDTTELVDEGDVADYVSFNRVKLNNEVNSIELIDKYGVIQELNLVFTSATKQILFIKDLLSDNKPEFGDLVFVTINYFRLDEIKDIVLNKDNELINFELVGDIPTAGLFKFVEYNSSLFNHSNKYTFDFIYREEEFTYVIPDLIRVDIDKYGLKLTPLNKLYPEFMISSCKLIKNIQ